MKCCLTQNIDNSYITLNTVKKDASVSVFGLCPDSGRVLGVRSVAAGAPGRVGSLHEQQPDPHSHAVVLDPFFGRVAYVPDPGTDLIRQFRYDPIAGTLVPAGAVALGPGGHAGLGPRRLEFHTRLPVCYIVNELSEVLVLGFCAKSAQDLIAGADVPTLRLLQTVRTIPDAFCGSGNIMLCMMSKPII